MTSQALFAAAKAYIPGGVNSPVRAFGSVGMEPRFIQRSQGPYLWDVEGNQYLDYVCSWGPMILGHNHPKVREAVQQAAENGLSYGAPSPLEVEMAQCITRIAQVEMVRMVSSGTEAVMTALRLARGYTRKEKILKFEGCYHGHSDSMLVKAGSGALTGGVPSSAGVPKGAAADTLTAVYNDLDSVEALFVANKDKVAAVIVEPVAANMGVVPPAPGFLQGLRELCNRYGALLIFDEVITGFRLGLGGAQAYFQVQADLTTYGKIIGGGMSVGALGGRREIMEHLAPIGTVYQAGTLSGNPVAMAAGLTQLQILETQPMVYTQIDTAAQQLGSGLVAIQQRTGLPIVVNQIGSLCCAFFTGEPVTGYAQATSSDTSRYARFFAGMLGRGVYLAPSQFEAMFVSAAHTPEHIAQTLAAAEETLQEIAAEERVS